MQRPLPVSKRLSSQAAQCVTRRSLMQRMSMALPWSSRACATSATNRRTQRGYTMKVLILGSGGREHALAWSCAKDSRVETVYVAPGNAGTAIEPKLENLAIDVMDKEALANFAEQNGIALTIVGPEAPLVDGVV